MKNIKCFHSGRIVGLFVKIYFKKIFPERPPLLPPFQHLILQFGRKNKRMLQKIKTK